MEKYSETELAQLLTQNSRAAAAAREAGNLAEYQRLRALNEVLFRVYRGAGTIKDELEIEKQLKGPLQGIAEAGRWVVIGVLALLALPYLQRARK